MRKNPLTLIQLVLFCCVANLVSAQGPFKGSCTSGDCNNGNGVYQIAESAVYSGAFKDGRPSGKGKIKGPNWVIYGTFNAEDIDEYQEWQTGSPAVLLCGGHQKIVTFTEEYVQSHYKWNNFYEMNGVYFQTICSGTCTFFRGADWAITATFDTEKPNMLMGKTSVKYANNHYTFLFPDSGVWASSVNYDRMLDLLTKSNFSTTVEYIY